MTIFPRRLALWTLAALFAASPTRAVPLVVLNSDGNLFTTGSNNPNQIVTGVFPSGFNQTGEQLLAIDVRPSNNELYALSSSSALYQVDLATGEMSQVGARFGTKLNGTSFGFDIDPVSDTARVVSNTGQDLKIDLNTGFATPESPLAYAAGDANAGVIPSIVALAYGPSPGGGAPAPLYGLDSRTASFVVVDPDTGLLHTLGPGFGAISNLAGLDIDSSGTAYAVVDEIGLTTEENLSPFELAQVDLHTGIPSRLAFFNGEPIVRDIAVIGSLVPEPGTALLVATGLLGLAARPRRRA